MPLRNATACLRAVFEADGLDAALLADDKGSHSRAGNDGRADLRSVIGSDEEDAIEYVKALLSFLPQNNLDESIALQNRNSQPDEIVAVPPEQKWLFSNRSYWYPQNQVTDYASARVRLTVPSEFAVVASGIAEPGSPVAAPPAVLENSSRSVARASYSFSS